MVIRMRDTDCTGCAPRDGAVSTGHTKSALLWFAGGHYAIAHFVLLFPWLLLLFSFQLPAPPIDTATGCFGAGFSGLLVGPRARAPVTSKACENKCFSGYLARLGGQHLAGTVVVGMASSKAASKGIVIDGSLRTRQSP